MAGEAVKFPGYGSRLSRNREMGALGLLKNREMGPALSKNREVAADNICPERCADRTLFVRLPARESLQHSVL